MRYIDKCNAAYEFSCIVSKLTSIPSAALWNRGTQEFINSSRLSDRDYPQIIVKEIALEFDISKSYMVTEIKPI